jgi:hypothetical protein
MGWGEGVGDGGGYGEEDGRLGADLVTAARAGDKGAFAVLISR